MFVKFNKGKIEKTSDAKQCAHCGRSDTTLKAVAPGKYVCSDRADCHPESQPHVA